MDKKNRNAGALMSHLLLFVTVFIMATYIVKHKEQVDFSHAENIEPAEIVITEEGNTIVLDKNIKSVTSINTHVEVFDATNLLEDEDIDFAAQAAGRTHVVLAIIIV